MIRREDTIHVGEFRKTHGLYGELNAVLDIESGILNDEIPLIIDMDGILVPFYIESARSKGEFSSLVKLKGVDSETEAKAFVNKDIFMMKRDLEGLADEEGVYADDLTGYDIVDENGEEVGRITGIDTTTENVLFVVEKDGRTIFIPVVDEFVEDVDDEKHVVVMRLPDGLLDLN